VRRGDDVDLLGGEDARRRERHAEHRLDEHGEDGVALAQRVEDGRGVAVEREAELGQQRPRRLGDVVGRLALAHRLQEGDHLQQRVLARLRGRGVPRHAVGRDREAKDALLGHAHAVDALVAESEDGAGALVEQQVAAHGVGMVLGEPHRALAAAGLLVDDAHDQKVAVRRAPARPRERHRGRDLGRRLGLHVLRPAAPQDPVDHVARPRVALPLRGVGEHGVDVREQAQRRPVAGSSPAARTARGPGIPATTGDVILTAAAKPRDEVGAPLGATEQVDLEARVAQHAGEQLLRRALVARRVDRVDAHQLLQQLGRLALEVVGHSSPGYATVTHRARSPPARAGGYAP
jgi:hypothetical protein